MGDKASGTAPVLNSPRLHNRFVDAANLIEREQLGRAIAPRSDLVSQTSVRARNNTGGDLARGSVVKLTSHELSTGYRATHLWMGADTPADASRKFGIFRKATPDGQIGECQVAGVCIARLTVVDSAHTHAEPVDGQTYLRSSVDGPFVILDKDESAGEAIVVFRSSAKEVIRFELTSPLDLGATAYAKRVMFASGAYVAVGEPFTVKDFTAAPGSWQGVAGFRGWCQPMADSAVYEVLWMENFARFVEFELTENMGYAVAGQAAATITGWYDLKEPTADPVIVTDPRGLFKRALTGAKGLAWYNPKTDKYVVVKCQTKAGRIRGTLAANWTSSSVLGNVSDYWGSANDVQNPADEEGQVALTGSLTMWPKALEGAEFEATYDEEANVYNITTVQQLTIRVRGAIPSALSPCGLLSTMGSFEIDGASLTALTFSPFNLLPAGTQTVINEFGWSMDVGATFFADIDPANANTWLMTQGDTRCADPDCEEE